MQPSNKMRSYVSHLRGPDSSSSTSNCWCDRQKGIRKRPCLLYCGRGNVFLAKGLALRNRPPGLEFYPSSHRLSVSLLYLGNYLEVFILLGNIKFYNFSISPVINYVPKKYKLKEANWQSSSVDKTSGRSQRRREAWLYF
ncbi:hypothetical protein OPV22_035093 [Ensete ventricosum]|uniref:Uncharacterized protein n=1 Tax=Ensete ventricosum TaxID=4639 RepID=A0AAX5K609_ENSVE|nr:hypothetical protein OPV22_035093 [Ensete ventricosum]